MQALSSSKLLSQSPPEKMAQRHKQDSMVSVYIYIYIYINIYVNVNDITIVGLHEMLQEIPESPDLTDKKHGFPGNKKTT